MHSTVGVPSATVPEFQLARMKVDDTISWRTCQVTRNVRLGLGFGGCVFENRLCCQAVRPPFFASYTEYRSVSRGRRSRRMGDVCSVRQGGTERSRVNGNIVLHTFVLPYYPTRSTLGFFHRWLCGWLPARVYSQRPPLLLRLGG